MDRLNRDVYIAVVLLVLCGVLFWATFDIREPGYGMLLPSAWPRTILVALTILSLLYLFQSLRRGPDVSCTPTATTPSPSRRRPATSRGRRASA